MGASADAETGSRADASSPQAVSTEGFDPARVQELLEVILYDAQDSFGAAGCKLGRIAAYAQEAITLITGETLEELWVRRRPIRKRAREFRERLTRAIANRSPEGGDAKQGSVHEGGGARQGNRPESITNSSDGGEGK